YFRIVLQYFANFRNFQKINKRYTYSHNHAFLQCFAIFHMVSQFNIKFLFYLFIIIIHYILHLLNIHFFIIYYVGPRTSSIEVILVFFQQKPLKFEKQKTVFVNYLGNQWTNLNKLFFKMKLLVRRI